MTTTDWADPIDPVSALEPETFPALVNCKSLPCLLLETPAAKVDVALRRSRPAQDCGDGRSRLYRTSAAQHDCDRLRQVESGEHGDGQDSVFALRASRMWSFSC